MSLVFQKCTSTSWIVSLLVSTNLLSQLPLELQANECELWHVETMRDEVTEYHKFTLVLRRGDEAIKCSYTITLGDLVVGNGCLWIPAKDGDVSFIYESCNAFTEIGEKNWKQILTEQDDTNILISGGDLVYCDDLWNRCGLLKEWLRLSKIGKMRAKFTKSLEQEVDSFYKSTYESAWGRGSFGRVLKKIPLIAMWDDHKIFDGYGSYPDWLIESPVIQGIYRMARKYFALFQLHLFDTEEFMIFNKIYCVDNIIIVSMDHRSERRMDRIMTKHSFSKLMIDIREKTQVGMEMLILSSIPWVFPLITKVSDVIRFVPNLGLLDNLPFMKHHYNIFGTDLDLKEDLFDSWNHPSHLDELKEMIEGFLCIQNDVGNLNITILSGDTHVGGSGSIDVCKVRRIKQIIASPIGSPHMHPQLVSILKLLSKSQTLELNNCTIDQHIDPKSLTNTNHWLRLCWSKQTKLLGFIRFETPIIQDHLENSIQLCCSWD